MNVLAGLMNPAAIGQSVQGAFEQGRMAARQRAAENALTAYAQNPSAETAAAIAPHDPRTGIQLGQYEMQRSKQEQERQQQAQIQQFAGRAAQGDKSALLALWGVDWETASKLDKYQTEKALEGYDFIANAAYQIVQLPPEQRAQAWDAYVQQGVQLGFDGLAQYAGQYSDQALNSIVAKAGEMKEFQTFQQPKYVPVGEGGLSGFQFGQPIMQGGQPQNFGGGQPVQITGEADYAALPPGAEYIDPQGNRRTKGGAGASGLGANFLEGL